MISTETNISVGMTSLIQAFDESFDCSLAFISCEEFLPTGTSVAGWFSSGGRSPPRAPAQLIALLNLSVLGHKLSVLGFPFFCPMEKLKEHNRKIC